MINKKIYFYIDSIQDLNLDYIKKTKASLILRESIKVPLIKYKFFVNECKKRRIRLYLSNNINLLFKLRINGFYISAHNKKPYSWLRKINRNIKIIGSAHNLREIFEKNNQGCKEIVLSRLFKTKKKGYLDIAKFNLMTLVSNTNFIALGGINNKNIKKISLINCKSFAMLSELRNTPKYLIR